MYFNSQNVYTSQPIKQVWGGPNSGIHGGNDDGKGITDTPGIHGRLPVGSRIVGPCPPGPL
jgi:hypothetical protein